jgi:hypothetical protein
MSHSQSVLSEFHYELTLPVVCVLGQHACAFVTGLHCNSIRLIS